MKFLSLKCYFTLCFTFTNSQFKLQKSSWRYGIWRVVQHKKCYTNITAGNFPVKAKWQIDDKLLNFLPDS